MTDEDDGDLGGPNLRPPSTAPSSNGNHDDVSLSDHVHRLTFGHSSTTSFSSASAPFHIQALERPNDAPDKHCAHDSSAVPPLAAEHSR